MTASLLSVPFCHKDKFFSCGKKLLCRFPGLLVFPFQIFDKGSAAFPDSAHPGRGLCKDFLNMLGGFLMHGCRFKFQMFPKFAL